jgi:hypothetical protein
MMQRILAFLVKFFMVVSFCLLATVPGIASYHETVAEGECAELVWSEDDGIRHEIFASSLRDGNWSDPVMITNDNADNLHPSIDVEPGGRKWVVWTAIEESGMELRYSYNDGKTWLAPAAIPSDLASNIKPHIMIDGDNVVWVVWSGNDGGLDDVYFIRYIDGEWTEAKPVHAANQVPDILPALWMNEGNQPVVRWQTYQDGDYAVVESLWDGTGWTVPIEIEADETLDEQEALLEAIILPAFVVDTRQVFIRFFDGVTDESDCSR